MVAESSGALNRQASFFQPVEDGGCGGSRARCEAQVPEQAGRCACTREGVEERKEEQDGLYRQRQEAAARARYDCARMVLPSRVLSWVMLTAGTAGGLRFGDFYRAENVRLRVPPEVVRLVGWSRTGKSIFMQSVPWKAGVTADGLMRVELDFDWLLHNHVAEPMHTRSDYAPQLHPALAAAVRTVACLGVVDIIHSYLYLPHFLYPPAAVLFDAHTMAIGTRHSRFTKLGNDPSSLHMTALCK